MFSWRSTYPFTWVLYTAHIQSLLHYFLWWQQWCGCTWVYVISEIIYCVCVCVWGGGIDSLNQTFELCKSVYCYIFTTLHLLLLIILSKLMLMCALVALCLGYFDPNLVKKNAFIGIIIFDSGQNSCGYVYG